MRILNAKLETIAEEKVSTTNTKISKYRMTDKYPCWYADLEKGDTLDKYYWRVGCVSEEEESECVIKLVDIGDISNKEFLKKMFSSDFPLKLLDLFKKGGEESVMDWISKGM